MAAIGATIGGRVRATSLGQVLADEIGHLWHPGQPPELPPMTTATMRRLPSVTDVTRLKPEARV